MSKFDIYENNSGFRFNLVAANGEIIGTSEQYTSKDSCINGVDSVRRNAVEANIEDQTLDESFQNPVFEIFVDKATEFRFRLKAKNGEIILRSEGYTAKASCKKGIQSVRTNAPIAPIAERK